MRKFRQFILLAVIVISIYLPEFTIAQTRIHPTGAGAETTNLFALRDKYGFLWIGTTTGLACFDGNGMPANRNLSGIIRSTSNLRVNTLFEHGDDIWFATPAGLMVFDRKENKTYRFPHKTKYKVEISAKIDKILKADPNRVWIMTQGQGFFIFNTKNNTLEQDSRHGSFFTDAEVGSDGNIYTAALDGVIRKFTPEGKFIASYSIPGYTPNKSMIFMEKGSNHIWLASGSDLYKLNIKNGDISRVHSTAAAGNITDLLNIDEDCILLGTSSGIHSYNINENKLEPVKISNSSTLSSPFDPRITQLLKDSDNNIIVVSSVGELNILSSPESTFSFIPVESPYSAQNFVYTLCGSSDGKGLWIGSDTGINYYDISTGTLTKPAIGGLGSEAVSSITEYGDYLWIGTAQNGLILHNLQTHTSQRFHYQENVPYSIMSDEITDVFISSKGETFILTQWGICRYDYKKSEFYTLPEMGQQTHVITMAEDHDGGLWAATINNGLFYRKPGESRFHLYNSKTLNKSTVTIMLSGREGTLWVATQEDGIFRFDKSISDFVKFEIPMLSQRSASTMEQDADGTLWITSGKSIVQVTKEGKVDFNSSRILYRTPVLRSSTYLRDGQIAIGCSGGVQFLTPSAMHTKEGKVTTLPSSISFPFMSDDDDALESLGINVLLYTKEKITLPYDHNTFTIHLSANHPADLPSVNYDYKLEGVDKDWTLGTAQSQVTYNNIPPGTYRFMVKPSGLSDAETTMLTIRISPPWYLSIWAYIAYGVLAIILAIAIWILVRRSIRRHYNERIEGLRAQKEQEVWQSKMRFFVDLVHEIRTPLMLISLPLEYLSKRYKEMQDIQDTKDSEIFDQNVKSSRKYLLSMQNNLDYLLGITNQILDFRQVENDSNQTLNIRKCNLNEILTVLCKRFEDPMQAENKEIELYLPTRDIIAYVDPGKIERVLMNLVGNARKYCKSKVILRLTLTDNNMAQISISDDGTGIPEQERNNIFKRYYQIKGDNIATSLGTGLGLAYAKMVITEHHGDIRIDKSEYGGADFIMTIPLGSEADETPKCEPEIITLPSSPIDDFTGNTPQRTIEPGNIPDESSILVVDDNNELLDMICEGLESGGYNVIRANDGVEALQILRDQEINFIVSDVMMPRMDGLELLKHVKSDINTSHIPFIILTAKTGPNARAEGMEVGADIYLEKPFSMNSLLLQIENIKRTRNFFYMRRRGSEPIPVIEEEVKEAIKEEKLPPINKYDAEFLEKMNALMEENISDEEFTIDILAERLNMSRSSFYRKLKALMGMTPVDYMKNYRLDAAARQLREGARVTEVAANVGFTSSSYFAKCFREKYGILPRDYTASLR